MHWRLGIIMPCNVFAPTFMWWKSNHLTTDKLSILLSVAGFANHDNYGFRRRREMSTGLQLLKRVDSVAQRGRFDYACT